MKLFLTKMSGSKISVIIFVLVSIFSAFGASSDVDTDFNPKLTVDISNRGGNLVVQPDGKIIIFGNYPLAGGSTERPFVKRLNPDGSPDNTFDCQACRLFYPNSLAIQSDGKILIGGNTQLIRINENGSLDTSFSSPFNTTNSVCVSKLISVQSDNKSLIGCIVYTGSLVSHEYVVRLNSNGSIDSNFSIIYPPPTSFIKSVGKMLTLPDGKILIGGGYYGTYSGWLMRYSADGSTDNSFQTTNISSNGRITEMKLQPDGKYMIGAYFKVYRLISDGSIDTSFSNISVLQNQYITAVKFLSNGQIYIDRLSSNSFPTPSVTEFIRYNSNGSIDGSFNPSILNFGAWTIDASDRILLSKEGFHRLNFDGSIDTSFAPSVSADGYANAAILQSDGKILVIGEFGKTNGFNSGRITRIHQDGTTDTSFNTGSGFDVAPKGISLQSDGKILVSGRFTAYNGTPRTMVARLNADGSLDTTFNPGISGTSEAYKAVNQIVPLQNGKILIGGNFSVVNGDPRTVLALLNADGSLDTTFNPAISTSAFSTVYKIYVQSNGQIMVGGTFGSGLLRINADGSLDSTFRPVVSNISDILQRPDGKYLISYRNVSVYISTVVLLNNDGTVDYGFQSPHMTQGQQINAIYRQPNGNVIFGGEFNTVFARPKQNISRVSSLGILDILFPESGTNGPVTSISGQTDGKIIFCGDFNSLENVARSGIARVTLSNRTRATFFDYDGDGRADISVFRPSTNTWYELLSGSSSVRIRNFGENGDIPAPADYDGDAKTDLGIFRPSLGDWVISTSSNNVTSQIHYGATGDIPLPAMTVNGQAVFALYRPSNNSWYGLNSGIVFGTSGDKPLVGDFDGDGRNDPAIYRPSTGTWWYAASSALQEQRAFQWGTTGDIPAPADYDGDGKTDFAVYRPSSSVWYILHSAGTYTIVRFGLAEDKPVPADYDGDGKADIALYRPSEGVWYLLKSTEGFAAFRFGLAEDIPTPNAFIP